MMTTQLLDALPVGGVFIVFAIAAFAAYEIGFRIGRWWQDRMPGEQEGPTDMLVGSLLALMAFLLAVTMGMASDRFDTRRGLVLAEANAIEAVYMQAGYLPPESTEAMRGLLKEYLPLRVVTTKGQLAVNLERSLELHREMWAVTESVAASGHSPDLVSAFGDSLTELINLNQTRVVAGLYARVPETVVIILVAGSVLSVGMVGYTGGLRRRRSVLSAAVMVVALGVVLTMVVDLDRPQEGFLTVSQQALIDVAERIGAPVP